MDPIIRIIQYLFKKNNIQNDDETFASFFDNGTAFPKFVALAFNIKEIPNINNNPKLVFHKNMNNSIALQYLFKNNPAIAKISPNYTTDRDKSGLLALILTKLFFPLNLQSIIDNCNLIVKPLGIKFNKKNDIISANCILSLLNVLTDGKVPINTDTTNFDLLMKNSFEIANAPLVINRSSLDFQNQFVFLIQLEILFEFFKDKINEITQNGLSTGSSEEKKEIEKLKETEKENKISKQKEDDDLKEIEKQKELEKQKKLERKKEIEKLREIEQQKEIERQKELEQEEIQNEEQLEDQTKQEQDEQKEEKSEQNEFEDQKTDETELGINSISNETENEDLSGFSDFEDTDEVIDTNNESTELLDSNESSNKVDKSNKLSKFSSPKFTPSDLKSFDFSSIGLSTEENEIAKSSSESSSELSDDDIIEIEDVDDFNEDEEEEEEEEGENEDKSKEDLPNKRKKLIETVKNNLVLRLKRKKIYTKSDSIFDNKLLKTINAIDNKNFENFHQAIQNDEIPKFVMRVLNRKSIKNVILQTNNEQKVKKESKEQTTKGILTKLQLNNIKEVIHYLQRKEPKFKVLLFDFSNFNFIESSAVLFYRTFITYFYLKTTKQQLFKRCTTLLYSKIAKEDLNNEVKILTNWKTYVALGYYIYKKVISLDDFDVEGYFGHIRVPFFINKDFLEKCSLLTELPITIYCQLQIIFDRIDDIGGSFRVIEIFANAIRGINMKIPKSDVLASSIRAKNISLILQKKEYKNYIIQKNLHDFGVDHEEEERELQSNKKKLPTPPQTFSDRNANKNSLEIPKDSIKLNQSADSFWNPPDLSFAFDNGILYRKTQHEKRKNKSQIDWTTAMKDIQENVQNKLQKEQIQNKFLKTAELYKFFYYNEANNKWEQDEDRLYTFSKEKVIKKEMKTPLILFFNSNDEDLKNIAINSKMVIDDFPDLNDDKMYVYGFADKIYTKPISEEEKNEAIIPIFLFLHIPSKFKELPNISTIIYSIYTFLCFICDIEIVVLNKNYYNDQIDLLKSVNSIINSYKEIDEIDFDSQNPLKSTSELHLFSASDSSDEENEFFDDDDDDIDFIEEDLNERNDQEYSITKISNKVFTNKRKIVALVNDENDFDPKGMEQNFNKNSFFSNKKLEIDQNCQIHYINVKDYDSYKSFTNNLADLVLDEECSTFDDVSRNFRHFRLTRLSSNYIKLKNEGKWEEKLNELINERYSMYEKQDNMHHQYLSNLSNLRKEILTMSPSIDEEFINKCDKILYEIQKNESQNNKKIFINEIENSSKLNLIYLKKIIENEKFWDPIEKEDLKYSHAQFLKDEFFNIIKKFYPNDLIKSIYEENRKILNDRIKDDIITIDKYFDEFENNLKRIQKSGEIKIKNEIKDKFRRGTNYAIREAENTREIIVTVQIKDDLRSEIKQDF